MSKSLGSVDFQCIFQEIHFALAKELLISLEWKAALSLKPSVVVWESMFNLMI